MWCTNAGHGRDPDLRRRSRKQAATLDYAPPFQFGIPQAFELASRIADLGAGGARPRVLLQLRLGSGRHRAEDRARLSPDSTARAAAPRLIGRERGYHGVGFGGTSVGGIVGNRKDVRLAADRRRPSARDL